VHCRLDLKVLLATLVLFAGCKDKDAEPQDLDEDTGETVATVDCEDTHTWTTVGAPFFYTWCTPCHTSTLEDGEDRAGATTGVDFDDYDDVVAWASRIEARAIDLSPSPMPPSGGPSDEELARVAEWIECGLPE